MCLLFFTVVFTIIIKNYKYYHQNYLFYCLFEAIINIVSYRVAKIIIYVLFLNFIEVQKDTIFIM